MERHSVFMDCTTMLLKWTSSPSWSSDSTQSLLKTPGRFFVEIDKLILKFIWKWKTSRIEDTVLKKEDKVGFVLHNFRAYSKTSHEENMVLA